MQGNRIRERRELAGLTQRQVSELTGLHEVTLSRVETGANTPSVETLMKLASALGCAVGDLLPPASSEPAA